MDNYDDALDAINQAIEKNQFNVDAIEIKADILRSQDRIEETIIVLEKLIDLLPNELDKILELSQLYIEHEDFEQSINQFDTVLDQVPNNADALLGKAYALYMNDQNSSALETLDELDKNHPELSTEVLSLRNEINSNNH